VALNAPFADRFIDKFGAPRLILTGFASLSIGYLLFLRLRGWRRIFPPRNLLCAYNARVFCRFSEYRC
jgi:hypothetical protein